MLGHGCSLRAGVLGISYKTADLIFREEFARIAQKMTGERAVFLKHPTVLLSTCNRTEIYFSAEDLAEAHSDFLSFLRSALDEPFEHRLYAYFGIDCFSHLSRVASGLDSAILAETEIQRQVRLAYARSSEIIALPSCIHFMFQKSLKVAKAARHCFVMERGAITLHNTIWRLAEKHFGELSEVNILLVGYSEINRGLAAFFMHRGISGLTLVTRNPSGVTLEGATVRGREWLRFWNQFDLIVCAGTSEEYLIGGRGSGQIIFDLSVPRNADPCIQGAIIWNIEQINTLVEQNRRLAEEGLSRAEHTVQEYVHRLAKLFRMKSERATLLQAL